MEFKNRVVSFLVDENLNEEILLLSSDPKHGVVIVERKNLTGADFIIEILIGVLSSTAAELLSEEIQKFFSKKRTIKIRIDGVEVDGLSIEEIKEILNEQKEKTTNE